MPRINIVNRLKSPLVLLMFAVALAAVVAYIAYAYLQQRELRIKEELAANNTSKTPKVAVVVPRADAAVGVVVDQGLFVTRQIDQDLVYPDTVLSANFASIRGQRLARPVLRGRPLRVTDLLAPEIRDVASVLPNGKRALTIEIDNVNSIAQTLRPGHHVDVFLLSTAAKGPAKPGAEASEGSLNQATLYMQNLSIIATGQQFLDVTAPASEDVNKMVRPGEIEGQRDKGFDTVTVLVSPAEAARLLVGQKIGTYRVALRGEKDDLAVAMRPLTGADVLPTRPSGAAGDGVEFIVGGRSGGGAALLPTLVARGGGLPDSRMRTTADASQAGAGGTPAVTRSAVEDVIRSLTQPHSNVDPRTRSSGGSVGSSSAPSAP